MDTNTEGEVVTLTEFLLARIAEDEAVAREAIDPRRPGTHWQWEAPDAVADPDAPRWLRTVEEFPTSSGVGPLPAFPLGFEFKADPARGMDHIARHDPARVLAECEAKRRIVELRESAQYPAQYQVTKTGDGPADVFALTWRSQVIAFDAALSALALPYADHPDYRQEWKP